MQCPGPARQAPSGRTRRYLGSECEVIFCTYGCSQLFNEDPGTSARFRRLNPHSRNHVTPAGERETRSRYESYPSPVTLEHWDERHAAKEGNDDPSAFVTVELAPLLPEPGRAIDVAGGRGRNSRWLADRGWDVTLADFSPVALAAADADRITTVQTDLETDLFREGPWDLILVVHYLDRELFPTMRAHLTDDGLLAFAIATEHNLERHDRPPLPYLLSAGEAPGLVAGMRILYYAEGWSVEGRHEARVVARRR